MSSKVRVSSVIVCATGFMLVGCQTVSSQSAPSTYGSAPMYQSASASSQQANAQTYQQPMMSQPHPAVLQEVSSLKERLHRVENAMIRLDRRMKIIERNELARITGNTMQGASTPEPQGGYQPMNYTAPNASAPATAPVQNRYMDPAQQPLMRQQSSQAPSAGYGYMGARFQPMSYNNGSDKITSSLGVASHTTSATQSGGYRASAGLPSLADKSQQVDKASVSIWTVNYEQGKVWPERSQLLSSRQVVDAIKGEKPVALYARGARPASKEFRERVRALSKYLAKVTDKSSLPISSMPAEHMSGDVIEIVATQ